MHYFFSLLSFLFFLSKPAFAYLDPGAGSFVLQMVLAGGLAVTAALKVYWFKVKSFLQKFFFNKQVDEK